MTPRANYFVLAAKGMEILLNLKTYHHAVCHIRVIQQGASAGRFGSVLLIGALLMETSRELH